MKRYPKYKDSGISWLGQIPEHWEVKRLSQVSYEHYISNKDVHHQNLLSLSYGNIIRKDINKTDGLLPSSFDTYQIVVEGNIILRLTDLQNDHKSLRVGLVKEEGIITSAYVCIAPINNEQICSSYLYSLLHTYDIWKLFYSMGGGIRQGLNWDGIKKLNVLIPPLAEQQKIVEFLDSKISKIDSYISEKEKEVKLLTELKQSQIAQVVTKGINPNVPMKDSSISWIGQIPEHWEMKRAKFMFKKHKRPCSPNDEVITCFRDGQVTLRKNRRTTGFTESEKYDGYQGIKKGDLVIHQMDAFAGSIGVSDSNGMGTSVYHCCTPLGDYSVYYYAYLIRQMALSGYIQSLYKGIRERSSDFSFPIFGNQFLVIPPLEEQKAIVEYINTKCQSIDSMISNLESEIAYLKEYKQSLIADAVTGAINVQ